MSTILRTASGAGGLLAVFSYAFQLPPEVVTAFAEVYRRVVPDSSFDPQPTRQAIDAYQVLFTRAENGIREAGGFDEPERWRFDWEQSYTRDEWLDQVPTIGTVTQLPPDKLAPILESVGDAIDAMGGCFKMPYAATAVTAVRAISS